jgi:hypothetical protein
MKNSLYPGALLCALLLAGGIVQAQEVAQEVSRSGQPRSWDIHDQPYANPGYGAARWGMGVEEVKRVIEAAWPGALATAKVQRNALTRTAALAITVPVLEPGPGPAEISYVFGATSHGLTAVHLTWTVAGNPSEAERAPLMGAATRLASGLVGYQWQDFSTTRGLVTGPGELIVFSGRDERGGAVEVRVGGMPFEVEVGGPAPKREHRAPPPGPALLRQSFVANVDRPDIFSIPAGAF